MDPYYQGQIRQKGSGLGGVFSALGRHIIPLLKNTALPLLKSQAKRLAPTLAKSGIGLVSDIVKKKNLKSALKARGKNLGRALGRNLMTIKRPIKPRKRQSKIKRRKGVKRRRSIF